MSTQYLYPLFAMVALVTVVGGVLFVRRFRALRNRTVDWKRFKTFNNSEAPDDLLKAERHFINLFEVPVLFYPAMVTAMVLPLKSEWGPRLAWIFVTLRCAQAAIHLWRNDIRIRASLFITGFLVLLGFWVLIAIQVCA